MPSGGSGWAALLYHLDGMRITESKRFSAILVHNGNEAARWARWPKSINRSLGQLAECVTMETSYFGRTGVSVSRLGFGGTPAGLANYLQDYSPQDSRQRSQVVQAVQRAVELGITYFDTAPGYGQGESEAIFGVALQGVQKDLFLATKVNRTDREPQRSVEASLQRIRRDCVDLVQVHGTSFTDAEAEALLAPGGLLEQLETLRDQGLLRFIGFTSEDNNPAVFRFIESGRFDVMQIGYNLLFQHPYETSRPFGSMFAAERQGMGICTMRALTSGIFQKWIQMVNPLNTFDYNGALLQFVLSNPLVDVALVGMRTPEEVESNVRYVNSFSGRIDIESLHRKYLEKRS
jgi:uncharacterized protein